MNGRPLRVVHVSFHADAQRRDGEALLRAWPTLPAVAAAVARSGVAVSVVQTAHQDETIRSDGVDFHFVGDTRRRRSRVTERVISLAPDLVHVHGLQYSLPVRALMRSARAPVLVQDHGGIPPRGWRRMAWRWAFRPLAGVAFTTREQATPWIDRGVLRADIPVFTVLEGSSSFTPGDQSDARRLTGMFGDPCLLWTSRLDANKDPLMMLDAFALAAPRLTDPRLWCCFGDAPLLSIVQRRIAASPVLREHVRLFGARPHDHLEACFRAADFYVQTSHREAAGYSLLEALSCGTTPLVTDIPAARRIVGDAGSLTPVGDAAALAAAIVDWSAGDRRAQRHAARARFESALTFDTIGRELRLAYESLAASARPVGRA